MTNPSLLPVVRTAQLPEKYTAAKEALAACNRLDECKDWADKSQALASYARQSNDKEMEKTAMRIRARAIQRCGQLLEQLGKSQERTPQGTYLPSGRKRAADNAGLSSDQSKVALRVARINGHSFEEQVESNSPPTITELAHQGKQPSKGIPIYERLGMTKQAFQAGMYFRGDMSLYVKAMKEYDPKDVIAGSTKEDLQEIKNHLKLIDKYHNKLKEKL